MSYRRFLADFARSLRTAVSLDDTLVQLVEQGSETMHIAHASVFLRSEPQGDYRLVEARGLPEGAEISLEWDNPLIAGHNPPILSQRDRMLLLKAKGMALGIIENIELERREVELAEGDVVVFYTDGVTEAINEGKEEFGQGRLAEVIVENRNLTAQGLIDKINAAVTAFTSGEPQFDDSTLVVLKCV